MLVYYTHKKIISFSDDLIRNDRNVMCTDFTLACSTIFLISWKIFDYANRILFLRNRSFVYVYTANLWYLDWSKSRVSLYLGCHILLQFPYKNSPNNLNKTIIRFLITRKSYRIVYNRIHSLIFKKKLKTSGFEWKIIMVARVMHLLWVKEPRSNVLYMLE